MDLAVATLDGPAPAGVAATVLAEEAMCALLPPDDPLAGAAPLALEDLRGRAFILAEPGSALREVVMAACQRAGYSPVPLFELSDPATARLLAHGGLGVSVVPVSWLDVAGPAVGHAALAAPAPRHRVEALTPAAGASPAAALLMDALRDAASEQRG
jgi:DNA-binding transcriptional LysR family regulator